MKNVQGGFMKARVVLLVAFVLVIVLGIAGYFIINSKPYTKAADKFVAAMKVGDTTTSYNMMTGRLQAEIGNEQAWQEQLHYLDGSGVHTELVDIKPVANPYPTYPKGSNPHQAMYSFTFSNGKKYTMSLVVLEQNNSWKVDEFDSELQG